MKKLVNALLNILVLLSIPVIVIFALTFLKVITPTIVISGSMEPGISTGSLIINKTTPAEDLEVGDVAALPKKGGVLVTHRIVKIDSVIDNPEFREITMKGDANNAIDIETYTQKTALTPLAVIPIAGYIMSVIINNKIAVLAFSVFSIGVFAITRMLVNMKKEKQIINESEELSENKV